MQSESQVSAIITGSTGMVGEGVLYECLQNPLVKQVLVINRKPGGYSHPKLVELFVKDFFDLSAIEAQLKGYNACFFCLGVSSVGMKKDTYYHLTYDLTMHFAQTLSRLNPDMTFCYVSGAGTDSTEEGRSNWAKVKGKTENDLMKLPFKSVYAFRPGFIKPIKGLRRTHKFYKYINWLFPVGRLIYPSGFARLTEIGKAMIHAASRGYSKPVLEGKDIIALAKEKG